MRKNIAVMEITVFFILIFFYLSFAEETITITTYYPSPYGSYNDLYVANRLGIGTTAPGYALSVAGVIHGQATTNSGDVLRIGNDTKLVDIDVANTAGLYGLQDSTIASLKLGSSGGTISGYNGNVGIGTAGPVQKLDVRGKAYFEDNTDFIEIWPDDGAIIAKTGNMFRFGFANDYSAAGWSEKVRIDSTGNVGIGTVGPGAQLHVADIYAAGGKNILIGDDTYLTDIDVANMLGIYGNQNSDRAGIRLGSDGSYIFGDNGNVGIGTASPNSKLDVAGYIQVLDQGSTPALSDCDAASEYGRMVVVTGANRGLYVCLDNGWYAIRPGVN